MGSAGAQRWVTPVLVGGHESAYGADLAPLVGRLPGAVVTTAGRSLAEAVSASVDIAIPAVVLPVTWGRDPVLVAETAKVLRWIGAETDGSAIALAAPFGTPDHLVAWLRRAAAETARNHAAAGVVVAAPAANPFDDAELHRLAHLVRAHGAGVHVEVACVETDADVAEAVRRSSVLGCEHVTVVPAGFARREPTGAAWAGASSYGPLLTDDALLGVIDQRIGAADRALEHGDDGIAAGLRADRGYGHGHFPGREGDDGAAEQADRPLPREPAPAGSTAPRPCCAPTEATARTERAPTPGEDSRWIR